MWIHHIPIQTFSWMMTRSDNLNRKVKLPIYRHSLLTLSHQMDRVRILGRRTLRYFFALILMKTEKRRYIVRHLQVKIVLGFNTFLVSGQEWLQGFLKWLPSLEMYDLICFWFEKVISQSDNAALQLMWFRVSLHPNSEYGRIVVCRQSVYCERRQFGPYEMLSTRTNANVVNAFNFVAVVCLFCIAFYALSVHESRTAFSRLRCWLPPRFPML